jgi:NitT/TauT family transport system substrate-binding protein
MQRRSFIAGSSAAGAFALAGGFERGLAAEARPRTPVRLGYVGTPCEAITYTAPDSTIFRRHHLDARLTGFERESGLLAALSAGTIDAASLNLPALLGPLAAGSNVRVTAGLHAGCLRVVAPDDVVVRALGNLKGASIAIDRLHSSSMNLLSALLQRQGIDPERDVRWRVYAPADMEAALDAKAIDCVAVADPVGYALIADKKAVPYLNTADGGFSCGDSIGRGHHCFLALSGRVVDAHPAVAAALTRAYLESSSALQHGVGGDALAEQRGGFVAGDLYGTIGMLSSYDWGASTDLVLEEIELTARDFRRAGLLPHSADPASLAERAFADVLGA